MEECKHKWSQQTNKWSYDTEQKIVTCIVCGRKYRYEDLPMGDMRLVSEIKYVANSRQHKNRLIRKWKNQKT